MFFGKLFGRRFGEPKYVRRARAYLEEARMATLEHSVAAEHYLAMAQMYADRAARLEKEIKAWEEGDVTSPEVPDALFPLSRPKHLEVPPVPQVTSATGPLPVGVVRAA